MLPKVNLIRITKKKDGTIELDKHGKLDGRGAYICKDKECLQKCTKTRGLNRAFKNIVPQEIYDALNES